MTVTVLLLFLLTFAAEITKEVSFKLAANKNVEGKKRDHYLLRLIGTPRVWFGFFCWGVEIVAWIMVLSRLSLSIAFPMMSLCYCGTIIASKYILHEEISMKKWIGVVSITIGVAIIGSQGIG